MKRFDYYGRLFIALGLVGVLSVGLLFAQGRASTARRGATKKDDVQVSIKRVRGLGRDNMQRTPEYKTNAYRGRKNPGDWVEIRVEYDTGGPEWVDELVFSYYVMCRSRLEGDNVYSLYRRTVKYVDIERDQGHCSCMYLRPNTVERHGEPVAIAVIISADGNVVAQENETAISLPDEWWSSPAVLESKKVQVTIRDGVLLTRNESPWAFINIDDYEAIKAE